MGPALLADLRRLRHPNRGDCAWMPQNPGAGPIVLALLQFFYSYGALKSAAIRDRSTRARDTLRTTTSSNARLNFTATDSLKSAYLVDGRPRGPGPKGRKCTRGGGQGLRERACAVEVYAPLAKRRLVPREAKKPRVYRAGFRERTVPPRTGGRRRVDGALTSRAGPAPDQRTVSRRGIEGGTHSGELRYRPRDSAGVM